MQMALTAAKTPGKRRAERTRRYHLHAPGLVYALFTVLVGLAAVNRQNNLLFWILGVMLSALLISGFVSGIMMSSLRVRRLVAGHGVVGEPLTVRYSVTNTSPFLPAFGLHIEERAPSDELASAWPKLMASARAWIMHLGPRETIHGEATFWPTHRGEAMFDQVRIWTTFPFGIIKKSITISQPQHTLIYPQLYELRRDVLRSLEPQGASGARMAPRPGGGDDYFGMREFRPGDSMRQIAWKRTAALDQLVCVERTRPMPPRLRVVVNLTQATASLATDSESEASALEERAISLAASIVHAADAAGYELGLTVSGLNVPDLPIRRSHWHRARVLAALAAIDLDAPRGHGRQHRAPATMGERAAQVVIHPDRVEPELGRDDALHLSARQMKSLVVRPIGWEPAASLSGTAEPAAQESAA